MFITPGKRAMQPYRITNVSAYTADSNECESEDDDVIDNSQSHRVKFSPPPRVSKKFRPGVHWLLPIGLIFFVMVVGNIAFTALGTWKQEISDNNTYGSIRTYQTDVNTPVVGLASTGTTHITVMNLKGFIYVTLIPSDRTANPEILSRITLSSDPSGRVPVEAHFTKGSDGQHLILTIRDGSSGGTIGDFKNNGKGVFSLTNVNS